MLLWTDHVQNPERLRGFIAGLGYADIRMEGRYTNTCGRGDREVPVPRHRRQRPTRARRCLRGLLGYFLASHSDRPGQ
jgi:hypothetical protein